MNANNNASTKAWRALSLHPTLVSAIGSTSDCRPPTALISRVLSRTCTDFADVLVDSRCATGGDTVGTAASIWVHNNNTHTNGGGASTTNASTGAEATGGAGPEPLYLTPAAMDERRALMSLYATHCLLTASDGAGVASRSHEVALAVATDDDGACERLADVFRAVSTHCGVDVLVIPPGTQPSAALVKQYEQLPASSSGGDLPDASASGGGSGSPTLNSAASRAEKERPAGGGGVAAMRRRTVLITTFAGLRQWDRRALLSNPVTTSSTATAAAVAVGHTAATAAPSGDRAVAKSPTLGGGSVPKDVALHFAVIVSEDVGQLRREEEPAWVSILFELFAVTDRVHSNYHTPAHRSPHMLWLCLGPLAGLSPAVRVRLSRRSRRYYPLLANNYVPAAAATLATTGTGTTSPMDSTRMIYLLSMDEKDKEEQLRALLSNTDAFQRVLVMTHNRDIRHLYGLIQSWGIYAGSGGDAGGDKSGSNGGVFFTHRSDSIEKQLGLLLSSCRPVCGGSEGAAASGVAEVPPALLVGWDAFTAMDVMDIDLIVQYHPPQKSLTDKEWIEFIQTLHTTADSELEVEASLRTNPNNSASNIRLKLGQLRRGLSSAGQRYCAVHSCHSISDGVTTTPARPATVVTLMSTIDFSLVTYFMHQYQYSGSTAVLSKNALACTLSAVGSVPENPTSGGAVTCSGNPMMAPVLNISPSHPLFNALVTGGDGGAPAAATGDSPKVAGLSCPLTMKRVLEAKMRLERQAQQRQVGRKMAHSPPSYLIPCLSARSPVGAVTGGGVERGASVSPTAVSPLAAAGAGAASSSSGAAGNGLGTGGGKTQAAVATTTTAVAVAAGKSGGGKQGNNKGGKKGAPTTATAAGGGGGGASQQPPPGKEGGAAAAAPDGNRQTPVAAKKASSSSKQNRNKKADEGGKNHQTQKGSRQ